MSEIQLGCSSLGWNVKKFVDAVSSISRSGYAGIECSATLVTEYEDRLHVFEEILEVSGLKLASMNQTADFLNREIAEIEVERVANTARFLSANKAMVLVVSPSNLDNSELTNDDWTTFAAVLEEMGFRCDEFGVCLAYRPRAGLVGGSERDIKRVLSMVDEKVISLCFDSAEITLAGINPDRYFKKYQDRIIHTRLRDVSGAKRRRASTSADPGSAPQFGRGAVDIKKMGDLLQKNNYTGWVIAETIGETGTPAETSDAAYRYIYRKSGLFI